MVVVAVNCVPVPRTPVYHPPKVYPVLIGFDGRVPTVVAGKTTVFEIGLAFISAL